MYFILNLSLFTICSLLTIAFFTLLERKFLSYSQIRKGPNKVGILGLLQPFSDMIKLFSKEMLLVTNKKLLFMAAPFLSFLLLIMMWPIIPFSFLSMKFDWLLLICIFSLLIYPLMLMGLFSNSMYAFLGSIRSIVQMLSYEIILFLMILSMMHLSFSFSLNILMTPLSLSKWLIFLPMFFLTIFITFLMENNRTPYDFSEAESELVSGFNTEYYSINFSIVFLAEYGMIIVSSILLSMILLLNYFIMYFIVFMSLNIWARASYPRSRYDLMLMLSWLKLMPFMTLFLIYFLMF